jgi:predicted nucleic acid-binding protein
MKTVDASSLINLLAYPDEFSSHQNLFDDNLIAPAILVPEFLSGLRKLAIRKHISTNLVNRIVNRFEGLHVDLFTMSAHRRELWTMTKNFSPYDATYVLLAQTTHTPLITSDARMAKAAQRNTEIILLR